MEIAIKTVNLTKNYGKLVAVDHINFEVKKGEILGFLGPNGAGKTTTTRMLIGISKPTEGTAEVMGYDIQKQSVEAKELMGIVPDISNVYTDLSAWGNLTFTGRLYDIPKGERKKRAAELIINDGPPGIGCPVIASLGGVDMGLIVAEPTLSGIHDMERALGLLNHFKISGLVCVNKSDINEENTERIVNFCASNGVEVVGKIPFDIVVTEAMVAGKPIVEYAPKSKVSQAIKELWERILEHI